MAEKRMAAASILSKKLTLIGRVGGASAYPDLPADIDWDDPAAWSRDARKAFDPSNLDESTRAAFRKFKLDPRNPYHWRMLVDFFADAHYGERAGRGRPKKWNSESLCALLRHVSDARKKRPSVKRSDVFRSLVKPKALYNGLKPDALKHAYAAALDPKRNKVLFDQRDAINQQHQSVIELVMKEKGMAVSDTTKKAIEVLALDQALRAIGAPDSRWKE
jgi:hypothetical protein